MEHGTHIIQRFVILLYDRTSKSMQKKAKLYKKGATFPNCIKRVQPSKSLGEKSREIKGGSHEMAAMMLMK